MIACGRRELDEAVERIREGATAFARLTNGERIAVARAMQAGYLEMAEQIVRASCTAKGIVPGTPMEAQEWATGPWSVVRQLRLAAESLRAIDRKGTTPVGRISHTVDGRLAVGVFPSNTIDRLLFAGIRVDVHLQAGIGRQELVDSRAGFYRRPPHDGRTVLVLGAGNLAAIPAMDVITKLFNEGKTCLLKMSPVNAYLGPFMARAFAEPIRRNFLAIVYGDVEEAVYLAHHWGIDEIHLTGSDRTYESLVWGPVGPEREARKARNAPLLPKPVTAELGNISPVLVVPGPYTERELSFQAEGLAGGLTHNASFNCDAPKMLVTARGWAKRDGLLAGLERALATAPLRDAYYPGAEERWRRATHGRSQVRTIGSPAQGQLPWTVIPDVDATDPQEPAFSTEPFGPVLFQTEVGSDDPIEYLERSVDFVNNRLWGTLSADLIVHPTSLKDPRIADAFEHAIARLRYGVVTVNSWTGYVFVYASPPWGAYPGSSPTNIQSGTGWVHNTSMLEGIEKAVLRHPLTLVPKPATFPSHRTAHRLLRQMTSLDAHGSWSKVPGVVATAMRG